MPPFADQALSHFKLRFDQYNHCPPELEQRRHGRQNQSDGNEAGIAADEVDALADILKQSSRALMPSWTTNARIRAERPDQLPDPHIHRMHTGGARLQQGIRESSGGGTYIEGDLSSHIQTENVPGRRPA